MSKKNTALESFGKLLYEKRAEQRIGLREICRKVNYDPSNWSKIEMGKLPPPSDKDTLAKWAQMLGMKKNSDEFHSFVEKAAIAQGIIPQTVSSQEMLNLLPAFFRTVRNGKPSKKELDELLELMKRSL